MFTSHRLRALHTVLYALHGRSPTHLEMVRAYVRIFPNRPALLLDFTLI